MNIWSYCIMKSKGDRMKCRQYYFTLDENTANRHGFANTNWSEFTERIKFKIKPFLHRTWNHVCWTYTNIDGVNQVFLNGKPLKPIGNSSTIGSQNKRPIIDSSQNVYASSLIIG